MINPQRLFERLAQEQVEVILVGGVAMIAHGIPHVTNDIDLCYRRDPANMDRLVRALLPFNPRLRVEGLTDEQARALPFQFDRHTLHATESLTLTTDIGSPVWQIAAKLTLLLNGDTGWNNGPTYLNYIGTQLGTDKGETLLFEFLPLPKNKLDDFPSLYYERFPAGPDQYMAEICPRRIDLLKSLIHEHRPEVIFCYGNRYWPYYQQVFPTRHTRVYRYPVKTRLTRIKVGRLNDTIVVYTPFFRPELLPDRILAELPRLIAQSRELSIRDSRYPVSYNEYWANLLQHIQERGSSLKQKHGPREQHWQDFLGPGRGRHYAAGCEDTNEIHAAVILSGRRAKARFDSLQNKKDAIEQELRDILGGCCCLLCWERDPHKRNTNYPADHSWITFIRPGNWTDRTQWDDQFTWLQKHLDALAQVIGPRL